MTTPDELRNLADRVEAASKGTPELDAEIWLAIGKIHPEKQAVWDAPIPLFQYALQSVAGAPEFSQFTREMSATARWARQIGWFWWVGEGAAKIGAHLSRLHPSHCEERDEVSGTGATAELAFAAALLRANAADMERSGKAAALRARAAEMEG